MKTAIIGGTGTLGSLVLAELSRRGHDVRALSRSTAEYRVDLTTGEGLEPALAGCDVVVDASNNSSRHAADILAGGSRRLLAAEAAVGVKHHVCVSIAGCEQVPMGYFTAKAQQEQVVEQGSVPWSIVRATQFHELALATLNAGARWGVLPVPRARLQTIACAEVAAVVAGVAEGDPRQGAHRGGGARGGRRAGSGPHLAVGDRAPGGSGPGRPSGQARPGAARRGAHHRPARRARHHPIRGLAGGAAMSLTRVAPRIGPVITGPIRGGNGTAP